MQDISKYTQDDLWVWKTLFTRQKENITGKASQAYIDALEHMSPVLNADEAIGLIY